MQSKSLSLTLQNIQSYFPYVFFYRVRQNFILKVPAFALKNVIYFLKKHTRAQYKSLIDLSAVDYMEKKFRFEIFYSLLSLKKNHRISISTTIYENKFIDSITTIFPTANWYERETWDMFGIFFYKHPNLRRILTDYNFKGYPLRKDFPLTGYLEISYQDFLKRIVHEKVKLSQEYRVFSLDNPWADTNAK